MAYLMNYVAPLRTAAQSVATAAGEIANAAGGHPRPIQVGRAEPRGDRGGGTACHRGLPAGEAAGVAASTAVATAVVGRNCTWRTGLTVQFAT